MEGGECWKADAQVESQRAQVEEATEEGLPRARMHSRELGAGGGAGHKRCGGGDCTVESWGVGMAGHKRCGGGTPKSLNAENQHKAG